MKYKIGVIGMGFVGTAVREGLMEKFPIYTSDLNQKTNAHNGHQNHHPCADNIHVLNRSNIIFLCVNTPMNKDGSCNTEIVEKIIGEFDNVNFDKKKIVVVKSTVYPGFTEMMNKRLTNSKLSIVFNPEFLTEANFIEEFKNQNRIVLGGPEESVNFVADLYQKIFLNEEDWEQGIEMRTSQYLCTDSTTAEMVKYTANSFLATKVSFFNEMKQICDKLNIDFDEMISYIVYDKRIGDSHNKVPGPDGKLGFGLSCFPKDLNGLKYLAKELGVKTTMLDATWEKNLEVRPERDWEQLKGRAVNE